MNRRKFISRISAATGSAVLSGCKWWPSEGISNACLTGRLPEKLANHDVVLSAWQDINPQNVWDCHVHLIGVGDSGSKIKINSDMQSWLHPIQYSQFMMYLNATCAESGLYPGNSIDEAVVARLLDMLSAMPNGTKLMLLAFEHYHDEAGHAQSEFSAFYVPNDYTRRIAALYPEKFEWIASIHPYRADSVAALENAIANGARAVKWLPGAMGIDPSSAKCDTFYAALAKTRIPLLVHTGSEHAIETPAGQELGNPLLLRRPLQHKVRVILAHCATTGQSMDIDKGKSATLVENFTLFKRLMSEPEYENLLYGDLAAITQINRDEGIVRSLVENQQWHSRLLFGSDYPLPGVMPLISTQRFVDEGSLSESTARVLTRIRQHNVILYDFLLKRHLNYSGLKFSTRVFETRKKFLTE